MAAIELSVEQGQLAALAGRLAKEADGKRLKLELAAGLRAAVSPAVSEIRVGAQRKQRAGSVTARPTKKRPVAESDVSLGAAIARKVGAQTRMGPRSAGVKVRIRKTPEVRQFKNAPKRWNAPKFRRPVYGRGNAWVVQTGVPGYFDDPLRAGAPRYRLACVAVMNNMAERIAR